MSKSHNTCRNYPHVTKLLETMVYARRRRMRISQSVLAEKTGLTRLNAYYADKASQAEREKQLAGVI